MTAVALLRYAWAAPATRVGLLARVRGHEQAHARQYERWGKPYARAIAA